MKKSLLHSGNIPEQSLIFHEYAYSLQTVFPEVSAKQILLHYSIEPEKMEQKFTMGEESKYLLDEIYNRTYKTHLERTYCMRFLRPKLEINKIKVSISIHTDKKDERGLLIKKKINYELGETGYPSEPRGILSICPELESCTGIDVLDID